LGGSIADPERKAQPLAVRRCLAELLGAGAAEGSGDVALGAGDDDGGSAARKEHMQGLVTWLHIHACDHAFGRLLADDGILNNCEAYFTSEPEGLDFQIDVAKDIMSSHVQHHQTRDIGVMGLNIIGKVIIELNHAAHAKVIRLASCDNKCRALSAAATYLEKAKVLHKEGFSWSYEILPQELILPQKLNRDRSKSEHHLYNELIKTENVLNDRLDKNHTLRQGVNKLQQQRKKDLKSRASKQLQQQQDGAAADLDAGALEERMAAADAIAQELVREEEQDKKRANKKRSKAEKTNNKAAPAPAPSDPAASAAPSRPLSPTLQDEPEAEEGEYMELMVKQEQDSKVDVHVLGLAWSNWYGLRIVGHVRLERDLASCVLTCGCFGQGR